jgi:hypothetical protein
MRRDGTVERYPGCYDLQVSGFDIRDENDDGITEPGEHIFVERIQVHNAGLFPISPRDQSPL